MVFVQEHDFGGWQGDDVDVFGLRIIDGIAYDMIRFKRKEIDGDELFKAMKVKIGKETFKAAKELMDEEDDQF